MPYKNKKKDAVRKRKWRKAHPEKHREEQRQCYARNKKNIKLGKRKNKLKTLFWTQERYDKVFKEQKGKCAVCGRKPPSKRRLCADHDHARKIPRGILCSGCNSLLGFAMDNVLILERSIAYLKKFSS